jgi:hypothetical protein
MGLGLGNWSIMSDDVSNFTGGTIDNLTVTGSGINTTYLSANSAYIGSLSAGTYYSGSTPLWDIIEDYMTPPTSALTYDAIGMAISDETTALTSGATKLSFRMPYDFQLTGITAYLRTSGSTATIVDVNSGSTSLLLSAITIPANQFFTIASNIVGSSSALTDNSIITVDIDQAGTASAGLKLWLEGYRVQVALGSSGGNGGPSTFVQNGINTFTGGTAQYPTVNITGGTFNSLSASSISANTYFSGSTPLADALSFIMSGISGWAAAPLGTIMAWHKNLSGTPSLPDGWLECNGQTVTDTASPYFGMTLPNLNGQSRFLRGTTGTTGTLQGQGTNLQGIEVLGSLAVGGGFSRISYTDGGSTQWRNLSEVTRVVSGLDTLAETRPVNMSVVWIIRTKQTTNASIDLTGQSAFSAITAGSLSANSISSGSTNLYSIFSQLGHTHPISGVTGLQLALDTKANLSGASFTGNLFAPIITGGTLFSGSTPMQDILQRYSLSAHTHPISGVTGLQTALDTKANLSGASFTSLSANTFISGSTNLYSIFLTTADVSATTITAGSNISVSNVGLNYTIRSVDSPSFNNGSFSGSVSGTNIFSGSNNLNNVFAPFNHLHPQYATLSGANFTSLSATNIFSGSVNVQSYFNTINSQLATKANLSGANFTSLSATTLSGGTITSGSTNLYSIFSPLNHTHISAYDLIVAASDETTALTTGTSKVTFYAPRNFTLTAATATLTTSGSTTTTVDLNYEGSSVFSAPISVLSGSFLSTSSTTTNNIVRNGRFTVDFDVVGTGARGVKVMLLGFNTIS